MPSGEFWELDWTMHFWTLSDVRACLYQEVDCRQHGSIALLLDVPHDEFEDVGDPLRMQLQELGAAQKDVALHEAHRRLHTSSRSW